MIYLDNSATTALCPEAKEAMLAATETYGNPSSLHACGRTAAVLLETARENVAATLGLRRLEPGELVFTSCGSEADSLALLGTTHAKTRRTANRIVSTDSEHPAVENVLCRLETEGWEVVRIATRGGALDAAQLDAALNENTFLVSLMAVNNETGARYDVASAFALAKARNPQVITHTDAVQGYLKFRFTPASLHADLITLSAHKIHGPKGVGALWIQPSLLRAKRIVPFLAGGGQESGMRSGTENIPGIAAFGAAAKAGFSALDANIARMDALRRYCAKKLDAIGIAVKTPVGTVAPHILNLTLPDIKSETALHFLDARGICVSAGSACAAHGHKTSRSLLAFGATPHEADCSLRVSLCPENTEAQIDALTDALREALETLVRTKR